MALDEQRDKAFRAWVDAGALIVLQNLREKATPAEAIDCVFDDEDWLAKLHAYDLAFRKAPPPPSPRDALRNYFPWVHSPLVRNIISPRAKHLAKRCADLVAACADAAKAMDTAGYRMPHSPNFDRSDQLWFLSDYAMPTALRNALLLHRRGIVAVTATYPISSPVPTPQTYPIVVHLIEFARESLEKHLGTIANIPEAKVTIVKPDGSDVAPPERGTGRTVQPLNVIE